MILVTWIQGSYINVECTNAPPPPKKKPFPFLLPYYYSFGIAASLYIYRQRYCHKSKKMNSKSVMVKEKK